MTYLKNIHQTKETLKTILTLIATALGGDTDCRACCRGARVVY
jgi:hypothetical protein